MTRRRHRIDEGQVSSQTAVPARGSSSGLCRPCSWKLKPQDKHCSNNGEKAYTYNQGIILGALTNLNLIDKNSRHIAPAIRIAKATISDLSSPMGSCSNPQNTSVGMTRYSRVSSSTILRTYSHLSRVGPTEVSFWLSLRTMRTLRDGSVKLLTTKSMLIGMTDISCMVRQPKRRVSTSLMPRL